MCVCGYVKTLVWAASDIHHMMVVSPVHVWFKMPYEKIHYPKEVRCTICDDTYCDFTQCTIDCYLTITAKVSINLHSKAAKS